jgi:hypothetical protein
MDTGGGEGPIELTLPVFGMIDPLEDKVPIGLGWIFLNWDDLLGHVINWGDTGSPPKGGPIELDTPNEGTIDPMDK